MTDEDDAAGVARLLSALGKLPIARVIAFRGLPEGNPAPAGATVTSLLTATSRNPQVAGENFAHRRLVAIASRKGRDIGMLAANPVEAEIVFLPGTTFLPLKEVSVPGTDVAVLLVEEVDVGGGAVRDDRGMPASLADFESRVLEAVGEAFRAPPIVLSSPGKFAGPLA